MTNKLLFPTSGDGPARLENCGRCHRQAGATPSLACRAEEPFTRGTELPKSPLSAPHLPAAILRQKWKLWQTLFSWGPKSVWTETAAIKLKDACSLGEKL